MAITLEDALRPEDGSLDPSQPQGLTLDEALSAPSIPTGMTPDEAPDLDVNAIQPLTLEDALSEVSDQEKLLPQFIDTLKTRRKGAEDMASLLAKAQGLAAPEEAPTTEGALTLDEALSTASAVTREQYVKQRLEQEAPDLAEKPLLQPGAVETTLKQGILQTGDIARGDEGQALRVLAPEYPKTEAAPVSSSMTGTEYTPEYRRLAGVLYLDKDQVFAKQNAAGPIKRDFTPEERAFGERALADYNAFHPSNPIGPDESWKLMNVIFGPEASAEADPSRIRDLNKQFEAEYDTLDEFVRQYNKHNPDQKITMQDIPDRGVITSGAKGLAEGVFDLPNALVFKTIQGPSMDRESAIGSMVQWYRENEEGRIPSRDVILKAAGLPSKNGLATAVYEGSKSFPTSAVPSILGGAAGEAAGTAAGGPVGAAVGARLGAMAGTGLVFYRGSESDFMQEVRDKIEESGIKMTPDEIKEAEKLFLPAARTRALWEAGPEAAMALLEWSLFRSAGSNAAKTGIREAFKQGAFKEALKKSLAYSGKEALKTGTDVASEVGTEGLQDYMEAQNDYNVGLSKTKPTFKESLERAAGPAAVTALLTRGTFGAYNRITDSVRAMRENRLTDEALIDLEGLTSDDTKQLTPEELQGLIDKHGEKAIGRAFAVRVVEEQADMAEQFIRSQGDTGSAYAEAVVKFGQKSADLAMERFRKEELGPVTSGRVNRPESAGEPVPIEESLGLAAEDAPKAAQEIVTEAEAPKETPAEPAIPAEEPKAVPEQPAAEQPAWPVKETRVIDGIPVSFDGPLPGTDYLSFTIRHPDSGDTFYAKSFDDVPALARKKLDARGIAQLDLSRADQPVKGGEQVDQKGKQPLRGPLEVGPETGQPPVEGQGAVSTEGGGNQQASAGEELKTRPRLGSPVSIGEDLGALETKLRGFRSQMAEAADRENAADSGVPAANEDPDVARIDRALNTLDILKRSERPGSILQGAPAKGVSEALSVTLEEINRRHADQPAPKSTNGLGEVAPPQGQQTLDMPDWYNSANAFRKADILERIGESRNPREVEYVWDHLIKGMPNESRIVYAISKNKNAPEGIRQAADARYKQIWADSPRARNARERLAEPLKGLVDREGNLTPDDRIVLEQIRASQPDARLKAAPTRARPVLDALAKRFGVRILHMDNTSGKKGTSIQGMDVAGKRHLVIFSRAHGMEEAVAMHEITHKMETDAPELWGALRDAVRSSMPETQWNRRVQSKRVQYERAGQALDERGIEGEVVADAIEKSARTKKFWDSLSGRRRGAGERILGFIEDLWDKITGDVSATASRRLRKRMDAISDAAGKAFTALETKAPTSTTEEAQAPPEIASPVRQAEARPVSEEPLPGAGGRLSLSDEQASIEETDRAYLSAVEKGDMETAHRMVDEAARRAGYDVGPVWHGTSQRFNEFDKFSRGRSGTTAARKAFWFTTDEETAKNFSSLQEGPLRGERIIRAYLKGNFATSDFSNVPEWNTMLSHNKRNEVVQRAIRNGKDGVVFKNMADFGPRADTYAVFEPSQIKSADPVTYDDNGEVIPLSKRFNQETPDIRYSLSDEQAYEDALSAGNLDEARRHVTAAAERAGEPKTVKTAYALLRQGPDGALYSPYGPMREPLQQGRWIRSESQPWTVSQKPEPKSAVNDLVWAEVDTPGEGPVSVRINRVLSPEQVSEAAKGPSPKVRDNTPKVVERSGEGVVPLSERFPEEAVRRPLLGDRPLEPPKPLRAGQLFHEQFDDFVRSNSLEDAPPNAVRAIFNMSLADERAKTEDPKDLENEARRAEALERRLTGLDTSDFDWVDPFNENLEQHMVDGTNWLTRLVTGKKNIRAVKNKKDLRRVRDVLVGTPFWTYRDIPAAWRVFSAAMDKQAAQYQILSELLNGPVAEEGVNDLGRVMAFQKKRSAEYKDRWSKWVIQRDIGAIRHRVVPAGNGYNVMGLSGTDQERTVIQTFEHEQDAYDFQHALEAEEYLKSGGSKEGAASLVRYRQWSDRIFNLWRAHSEELARLYRDAGLPEPEIIIDDAPISLKKAIEQMGDLRGSYMPRIRGYGEFGATATKKGANPVREHFLTNLGRAKWARQMAKRGYQVELFKIDKIAEQSYIDANLLAMNDIISKAFDKLSSGTQSLQDLGLTLIKGKTKDGVPEAILAGTTPNMRETLKELGGRWYTKESQWHFVNPPKNLESRLTDALSQNKARMSQLEAFRDVFIREVSDTIKERASQARKIGRKQAAPEDVTLGYEPDPIKAMTVASFSVAGGASKRLFATKAMRMITGTDVSFKAYVEKTTGRDAADLDPEERDLLRKKYNAFVAARRIDSSKQSQAYEDVLSYINEILRNKSDVEHVIDIARGVTAFWGLSGTLGPALVNLSAMPTTVPPAFFKRGVGVGRTVASLGRAAWVYLAWRKGIKEGRAPKMATSEERWALSEIARRHWDQAPFHEEAMAALSSRFARGWKNLVEIGTWTFSESEKANRMVTILGAFNALSKQHKGAMTDEVREKTLTEAKLISDEAHGVYGRENTVRGARGGTVGSIIFKSWMMFKTFPHNYLQALASMMRQPVKNIKPIAWMLLSPAALAGARASVATAPTLGAVGAVMSLFGMGKDDPEEAFYAWLQETAGKRTERFARYGLAGLAGVNIKGSLEIGLGDLPTEFGKGDLKVGVEELLGAPASIASNIVNGVNMVAQGDVLKGAEMMSPRIISGPIRAYRDAKYGDIGRWTNAPTFYGDERIIPTWWDTFQRSMNLNPARIAEKKEKQWSTKQVQQAYTDWRSSKIYPWFRRLVNPETSGTKEEWDAFWNKVEQYNARVVERRPLGVPYITPESLLSVYRNVLRPSKTERERAAMEAEGEQ